MGEKGENTKQILLITHYKLCSAGSCDAPSLVSTVWVSNIIYSYIYIYGASIHPSCNPYNLIRLGSKSQGSNTNKYKVNHRQTLGNLTQWE